MIETLKVTSRPRGEFTGRSIFACKCRAGGPAWRCNGVSEPLADCFGGSRCHFIPPAALCPPRLSFSGRFFLLLHVCSLSSLLPGRNMVACRPSRWSLGSSGLPSCPRRGFSVQCRLGGCPPSLLCGCRAPGSARGEVRSTESLCLLQPREPAGGKVLETDLQRRGPRGPANPVGDRDTLRESHLQLIKSLLCINALLEPSQILGRPVFVAFREVFKKNP